MTNKKIEETKDLDLSKENVKISESVYAKAIQLVLPGAVLAAVYNTVYFALKHKDAFLLESKTEAELLPVLKTICDDVEQILKAEEPLTPTSKIVN